MAERGRRARAKSPLPRLPLSSYRDSPRTLATSEARRLGAAFPHSITRRAGRRQTAGDEYGDLGSRTVKTLRRLRRSSGKTYPEALDEVGHAAQIHLEFVPRAEHRMPLFR